MGKVPEKNSAMKEVIINMKRKRKKTRDRIPTTEKLVKALQEVNDPKLSETIKKAKQGYYDDYKTTIAFPCIQLVYDLEQAGHPELAQRAKNGEWSAQKWEAKEWYETEGRQLIEEVIQDERTQSHNEDDI